MLKCMSSQAFFGVDWSDIITEDEAGYFAATPSLPRNESRGATWEEIDGVRYEYERIPRIIHQTWKTDTVPEKWASLCVNPVRSGAEGSSFPASLG